MWAPTTIRLLQALDVADIPMVAGVLDRENPLFARLHQEGLGDYLAPGMPTVFDGEHFAGEAAPTLGADTADVLTGGLGLTAADITRLTDAKTIAC